MVYYDPQILADQMIYSGVLVFLMNKLKRWKQVPFINQYSHKLNNYIHVATSFLAAAGINYNYAYTPSENGTLIITLTGISIASFMSFGKTWIVSYMMQSMGSKVSQTPDKKEEMIVKTDGSIVNINK